MLFRVLVVIISSVSLNALVGCVTWRGYSKPSIADDSIWKLSFSENRFDGVLELNSLQLSINPHNDGESSAFMIAPIPVPFGKYGSAQGGRIFEIDITIIPGSQMYTFTPSVVSLHLKGKEYLSTGYAFLEEQICFERSVDSIKPVLVSHELNKEIVLGRYNCFVLQFDVGSPDTGERFSVEVNGLKRGEDSVTVPEVHFTQGKRPSGF